MYSWLFWSLCFLMILSHCPFLNGADSCPDSNLSIKDGTFTISASYSAGSILRYVCPLGFYPHPEKILECKSGQWDPEPTSKQECRKVTCPNPKVISYNGEVKPNKRIYYVNDTTSYMCNTEYTFRGSATRVCQANGKWSGGTPICSRNTDHCPDPGIPPGASRGGNIFNIDDKVTYTCERNLKLIGSQVRVCQDGGLWSGKEPECYADFTYDTPEEVAEAFGRSLKTTVTMFEESGQAGKKIHLDQQGKLDIYIALDASDSIKEEDFDKAKDIIKKLIKKISYYEVSPNYEILIFTTYVRHIIKLTDQKRGNPTNLKTILEKLDEYKYTDKGNNTGTNINNAYKKILESMSLEEAHNKVDFDESQNVIIMFTDGNYNSGGNPKEVVNHIREKVIRNNQTRDKYLDLYAFGVGDDIDERMDEWVTKRNTNEKYFFKLPNMKDVEETLDKMIDEGTSMALCGLYKNYSGEFRLKSSMRLMYPWLIKISIVQHNGNTANCIGSLVTPRFILTAAHCFRLDDEAEQIELEALNSKDTQMPKVEQFYLHEKFDINQKQDQGIKEFYEYDVALIQLKEGVKISPDLRTICVPCTQEAHGALQLPASEATCAKHKEVLLDNDLVNAHFITHEAENVDSPTQKVLIKQNQWRNGCIEQIMNILEESENEQKKREIAEQMFTDNFLCTGGDAANFEDAITCKGDSGGPLVVEKNRLFQVGIISWGLKTCGSDGAQRDGRDFHVHVFNPEVQTFLKKYLGDGDIDTPLTFF